MTLPFRARLTLWYTALLAVALLIFSITVYVLMSRALINNVDSTLRTRITQIEPELGERDGGLAAPENENTTDESGVPTVVLSPAGRLVGGSVPPDVAAWIAAHRSSLKPGIAFDGTPNVRLATKSVSRGGHIRGYVLAWQSTKQVEAARHTLLLVLFGTGTVLLIIAGAGGLVLARRLLEPVADVTHTAAAISATDLHRRVPVGKPQDELSEMATTFNAMIDRLEGAVERERRFTADASHELRSPLAVIRAEATLALERPRAEADYRQALTAIDAEAITMEEVIGALLILAREGLPESERREIIALADVTDAAVDQCRQARDHGEVMVRCHVPPDLEVQGSARLLTLAIRNLVENAIKVSPPHSTVDIEASRAGENVTLSVCDQGPGIAPEHQLHIFDPFYQVSGARTPGASHGLGLAICRRIVEAHGGSLTVESQPGHGACFRIMLPA